MNEAPSPEISVEEDPDKPAGPGAATEPAVDTVDEVDEVGAAEEYRIGYAHLFGKGVPFDPVVARGHLVRAAEAGHGLAANYVGTLYDDGVGVPRDGAAAVEWFAKGAELGCSEARYNLGSVLFDGRGVDPDVPAAAAALLRASDDGHGDASYLAALMLLRGEGAPADPVRARRCFLRAVCGRHLPAQFSTLEAEAVRYRRAAVRRRDMREAIEAAARAGEEGDPSAAWDAALFLWNADGGVSQDVARALRLFGVAAEAGNPLALACVGSIRERRREWQLALDSYEAAAAAGLPSAQRHLGWLLRGSDRRDLAFDLVRIAALAGDVVACSLVQAFPCPTGTDPESWRDELASFRRFAEEGGFVELDPGAA